MGVRYRYLKTVGLNRPSSLLLDRGVVAGNQLPLAIGHLHPGIGPAQMLVERLTRICALSLVTTGRDRDIPVGLYLEVFALGAGPLPCLGIRQRLRPVLGSGVEAMISQGQGSLEGEGASGRQL
jgi:hypothetical protein